VSAWRETPLMSESPHFYSVYPLLPPPDELARLMPVIGL
jgi:hypothetical protein